VAGRRTRQHARKGLRPLGAEHGEPGYDRRAAEAREREVPRRDPSLGQLARGDDRRSRSHCDRDRRSEIADGLVASSGYVGDDLVGDNLVGDDLKGVPYIWRLPSGDMKLLYRYLRNYTGLVALALVLATINQVFSLLDPLIFRHVIDQYATRFQEYTTAQFFKGVTLLLGAAVSVAFISRVAKNFQDYFINVITQRLGAQLYSDGIRHSLELPYSVFEDQRSGQTLGRLQKVRTDVEKLIATSINVLFTSLIGIIFVMVYAFSVHWLIAPVYFLTVPILGVLSSVLSRRIKQIQKVIVSE